MSSLLQQAIAEHKSGNFVEAEKLYRATLKEVPQQPDALALLGIIRGTFGQHEEAIALVQEAVKLDPASALFRFHLGTVLMNAKEFSEATTAFRDAIARQPEFAPAHYNLANALRAQDDWKGCIEAYREALRHNPRYPEACNNLAHALVHEKQFDEGLQQARKAVELAPDYADGWLTLCNVAEATGDYALAATAGARNIELVPGNHRAWFGYGVALNRLDRHEEAIEAYQKALVIKPDRADIWDNLGQTYQSLNRLDEAEAIFRKTVEVAGQSLKDEGGREVDEKEYGNRHWHLALMELLRGKYREGFARYRSRFKDVGGLKRPPYANLLWKGESLVHKTILICDEQGFGDTLMLVRYLPLLKQQGARVILSVHPVLEELFRGWSGADQVITHGTPVPPFDTYASVFDLPHRFGTTLATIPHDIPYLPLPLSAPPLMLESGGRPKIGVVWGGSPLHKNDAKRSIPLKSFARLFDDAGASFYSLNRDLKAGDADLLPGLPVTDLVPRMKNFADAARFCSQLDLVITCDTATAHLAGGLGKKVWTLLPFGPDWRWMTGRDDSLWYPTMRLFRQERSGDWDGVIKRVKIALGQFLTEARS